MVYNGSFYPFIGTPFTPAQIDIAVETGQIPVFDTAVNPINWTLLYPKGGGKVNLDNEVLDLGDDIRGTLRRIINGEVKGNIEIPIADISYQLLVEKFGINPRDKTSTLVHKDLDGSYDGVELTGFPLLLLGREFGINPNNRPLLGLSSDTMAFLFYNFVPSVSFESTLDPKAQKIPVLKGTPVAVDGATYTGKLGKFGQLSSLV